jgi:lysophospholipase L1-like esterase
MSGSAEYKVRGPTSPVGLAGENSISLPGLLSVISAEANPPGVAQTLFDVGPARLNPTQAAAGNRATSVTLANGEQVLRFVRATPNFYNAAWSSFLHTDQCTVFARLALNTLGVAHCLLGATDGALALLQIYIDSAMNEPAIFVRDAAGTVIAQKVAAFGLADIGSHFWGWIREQGKMIFVIDGRSDFQALAPFAEPVYNAAFLGCANVGGANACDIDFSRVEIATRAAAPIDYKQAYRRAFRFPCVRVIYTGNSLTVGQGASGPTHCYPYVCNGILNATNPVVRLGSNIGHGAYTTTNIINIFPTDGFPLIDPFSETIAVCWEATNDIWFGATAADTLAHLRKWFLIYREHGVRVVAANVISRQWPAPLVQGPIAAAVNAAMVQHPEQYGDTFFDASSLFPTYTNLGLYDPDGSHLNDAGYLRFATGIAPVIQSLIDQPL